MTSYDVPNWAGQPPKGLHLDVLKLGQLVEKLIIEDKPAYFFGRNKETCDFTVDHASCSRVHAVLLYHKHLYRSFIVDLGSTHGTFLNEVRLDALKPTPVDSDSSFSFGASSRVYSLRERPQAAEASVEDEQTSEGTLLGLPDDEEKLDDLTEFNTAHNKRISMVGITEETISNAASRKRKRHPSVAFHDTDDIINPEDVDPDVGRFRNMIQSTVVVPRKRPHIGSSISFSIDGAVISPTARTPRSPTSFFAGVTVNAAPDISLSPVTPPPAPLTVPAPLFTEELADVKPRKKYAKEAWPGKKPGVGRLI